MKDEFLRLEKKLTAKEIRENLTEEGKQLEFLVESELQKCQDQTQELKHLKKSVEASAKDKVKTLKVQELVLSQEGQRLQDLVNTLLEPRSQDHDGDSLDKLLSQEAKKVTDSIAKVSEKANDSITQTVQTASDKLGKALFKPPETPPQQDQPLQQDNENRNESALLQKKNLKRENW